MEDVLIDVTLVTDINNHLILVSLVLKIVVIVMEMDLINVVLGLMGIIYIKINAYRTVPLVITNTYIPFNIFITI
jgi:hypothetical protein